MRWHSDATSATAQSSSSSKQLSASCRRARGQMRREIPPVRSRMEEGIAEGSGRAHLPGIEGSGEPRWRTTCLILVRGSFVASRLLAESVLFHSGAFWYYTSSANEWKLHSSRPNNAIAEQPAKQRVSFRSRLIARLPRLSFLTERRQTAAP
jgi:hypothetical protein